jgi:hypothetical protein
LLDVLASVEHFDSWYKRIWAIPDWFLGCVCDDARRYGLNAKDSREIADFLKARRDKIKPLVDQHRGEFTGVTSWNDQGKLM